jgi:polysaccharide biosynthesis/export protein
MNRAGQDKPTMARMTATFVILMLLLSLPARGAQTASQTPAALGANDAKGEHSADAPKSVAPPTYRIGIEDVLDISVWKEPNVSRSVPVRPDGMISLPLINDIRAAGLTPAELSKEITTKLEKFITAPQVTVTVTAINSQRAYIVGEVSRPGPITLLPGMTVLQALATAGGFTQFANEKHISILRMEHGKQIRYAFNYKSALRGDMKENILVKPGDTIVVP